MVESYLLWHVRRGDKKCSLSRYIGYVMVNPRLKEIEIVGIREASSQELVPRSSCSWSKSVGMELSPYSWSTKGMGMIHYINSKLFFVLFFIFINWSIMKQIFFH